MVRTCLHSFMTLYGFSPACNNAVCAQKNHVHCRGRVLDVGRGCLIVCHQGLFWQKPDQISRLRLASCP